MAKPTKPTQCGRGSAIDNVIDSFFFQDIPAPLLPSLHNACAVVYTQQPAVSDPSLSSLA